MEISSNLTLELFNQPFLLEKRIELLFAIQRVGSISGAAKEVPMSYKSAWEAVDSMNNLSHTPILIKETGGVGGGGTKLTAYGENVLKTYMLLKEEQKRFLKNLEERTDIDTGTLKTMGRLGMQISARNQIQGVVEYIETGKVNSSVYVKLKSGYSLVSVITNGAVDNLHLQADDEVVAIFKSSSVLLTTDISLNISARNKFQGVVKEIHSGEVNSEVLMDTGNSEVIASVITINAIKELGLKVGDNVSAIIKASDIILGK
jgi:molybdate transport system regulatory protein